MSSSSIHSLALASTSSTAYSDRLIAPASKKPNQASVLIEYYEQSSAAASDQKPSVRVQLRSKKKNSKHDSRSMAGFQIEPSDQDDLSSTSASLPPASPLTRKTSLESVSVYTDAMEPPADELPEPIPNSSPFTSDTVSASELDKVISSVIRTHIMPEIMRIRTSSDPKASPFAESRHPSTESESSAHYEKQNSLPASGVQTPNSSVSRRSSSSNVNQSFSRAIDDSESMIIDDLSMDAQNQVSGNGFDLPSYLQDHTASSVQPSRRSSAGSATSRRSAARSSTSDLVSDEPASSRVPSSVNVASIIGSPSTRSNPKQTQSFASPEIGYLPSSDASLNSAQKRHSNSAAPTSRRSSKGSTAASGRSTKSSHQVKSREPSGEISQSPRTLNGAGADDSSFYSAEGSQNASRSARHPLPSVPSVTTIGPAGASDSACDRNISSFSFDPNAPEQISSPVVGASANVQREVDRGEADVRNSSPLGIYMPEDLRLQQQSTHNSSEAGNANPTFRAFERLQNQEEQVSDEYVKKLIDHVLATDADRYERDMEILSGISHLIQLVNETHSAKLLSNNNLFPPDQMPRSLSSQRGSVSQSGPGQSAPLSRKSILKRALSGIKTTSDLQRVEALLMEILAKVENFENSRLPDTSGARRYRYQGHAERAPERILDVSSSRAGAGYSDRRKISATAHTANMKEERPYQPPSEEVNGHRVYRPRKEESVSDRRERSGRRLPQAESSVAPISEYENQTTSPPRQRERQTSSAVSPTSPPDNIRMQKIRAPHTPSPKTHDVQTVSDAKFRNMTPLQREDELRRLESERKWRELELMKQRSMENDREREREQNGMPGFGFPTRPPKLALWHESEPATPTPVEQLQSPAVIQSSSTADATNPKLRLTTASGHEYNLSQDTIRSRQQYHRVWNGPSTVEEEKIPRTWFGVNVGGQLQKMFRRKGREYENEPTYVPARSTVIHTQQSYEPLNRQMMMEDPGERSFRVVTVAKTPKVANEEVPKLSGLRELYEDSPIMASSRREYEESPRISDFSRRVTEDAYETPSRPRESSLNSMPIDELYKTYMHRLREDQVSSTDSVGTWGRNVKSEALQAARVPSGPPVPPKSASFDIMAGTPRNNYNY
ncbi:hypothetical protein BZA70DRAFT_128315 [Myxozyma melibiosi]|uniref:Uncharacterized protein n=1 Tax=Myxozyma melibiosi TaxID=54550 RepID=A0ABR1F8Y5_9ASCO